jgi:hypothetical protein
LWRCEVSYAKCINCEQTYREAEQCPACWNADATAQLTTERAKREEAERNYYTLCDAVCRESKGVEDACNQARAERARSAALEAEVERMRDIALTALRKLHARALIVLSQSPTPAHASNTAKRFDDYEKK